VNQLTGGLADERLRWLLEARHAAEAARVVGAHNRRARLPAIVLAPRA